MPQLDNTVSPQQRAYQLKAMSASSIGYAMDGFDMLALGTILPAIALDLHLTSVQSSALITWTLIGAMLGGVVFGALSDRYGRIQVLTWTIILFATFTGLCAVARDYSDLLIYRTIAGIGLGGEFGIGMALAAEACPPAYRGRISSYVALGWQFGALLAILFAPLLLPSIGWRGILAIGICPALIAWLFRKRLHDPKIFSSIPMRQRSFLPNATNFLHKPKAIKTTLAILILCSVQNFGYYGVMIWMPSYLANQIGLTLTKSSIWTAVTILGMMFGIVVFGQLADRIGRRYAFMIFQIGAAITALLYCQIHDPTYLLFMGALLGVFVNGALGGYGALISEVYPTAIRATAQNVLFNLGRGIGGFGPVVMATVSAHYSFFLSVVLLASLYLFDCLVTALWIPDLRNKELT